MEWIPDLEPRFRRQFEREGEQLLFRRNGTGAPVSVGDAEMEQAASDFRKRVRVVYPLSAIAIAATAIALALRGHDAMDNVYPVVGLILLAVFTMAFRWAWYGPTKRWRNRPALGAERRHGEARWDRVSSRSWARLLGLLALGTLFLLSRLAEWPPRSVGQWILLIVPALIVLDCSLACVRKLRTRQPA